MRNKHIFIPEFVIQCLLVLYLLYRIPITTHYISVVVFMIPFALLLIGLFLYGPIRRDAGGRFILVSLVYFCAMIIDELFIESNITYMLWNVLLNYLPLIIGYFLIEHKMDKTIRTFSWVLILSIIITCVTTYVGLQEYPNASRDLASGTDSDLYGRLNIGGFFFIYSLVICHPALVYLLRKRSHPIFAILMTVFLGMCIVASRYTIALVVFAISLMSYLIPVKESVNLNKSFFFWVLLSVIVLFWLGPNILEFLAEQEFLKDYSDNLIDISRMLQGKEVLIDNTTIRKEAYETSWESFVKYPVFGGQLVAAAYQTDVSGGHSYFLDTMAKWGLVGLVLVLTTIWALIKWYWRLFSGSNARYYALFCLGLSLIVAALNPIFWTFELGTVIPLLVYSAKQYSHEKGKRSFFGITFRWR